MKQIILDFLKTDRSFNKGRELYMTYGQKQGFKKVLNSQPENKNLLETLLHELSFIIGMSNSDFTRLMNTPIIKVVPVLEKTNDENSESEVTDTENPETPETENIVVDDSAAKLEEEQVKSMVTNLSKAVKSGIALRGEFPFLDEPTCPEELKILVADKMTAYRAYKEGHANLFVAENEKDLLEASVMVVENVIKNQAIYAELIHYRDKGEILGKHPIFSRNDLRDSLLQLSIPDLVKARENVVKRISKLKGEIADIKAKKEGTKPDQLKGKQDNLTSKIEEQDIINRLLGFKNE